MIKITTLAVAIFVAVTGAFAGDLDNTAQHVSGYSYKIDDKSWLYVHRSWSSKTQSQLKNPTPEQLSDPKLNFTVETSIYEMRVYKFDNCKQTSKDIGYFKIEREGDTANSELVMLAATIQGDKLFLCYRVGNIFVQQIDVSKDDRTRQIIPSKSDIVLDGNWKTFIVGASFSGSLADKNLQVDIAGASESVGILSFIAKCEGDKATWIKKP